MGERPQTASVLSKISKIVNSYYIHKQVLSLMEKEQDKLLEADPKQEEDLLKSKMTMKTKTKQMQTWNE